MKKFLVILAWLVCTILLASPFGLLYKFFIPQRGQSIFLISEGASNFFTGLDWSYVFFLTFLFTAFGGAKKYWWIGILLIPVAMTEMYLDITHIYFPVALALLGWGIGFGISKLMKK